MSESRQLPPTLKTWLVLALAIILTAVGQIFMKLSALKLLNWDVLLHHSYQWQLTSIEISGLLHLAVGIVCYFVSMLLWIYILSFLKLSRAYPMLSIAYVLVYLGAVFWPDLQEQFSMEKNLGILIIMIGVIIVSLPSKSGRLTKAS